MNNDKDTQRHLRLFNKVNKLLKREKATANDVCTAFAIGMAHGAAKLELTDEAFIEVVEFCWAHFKGMGNVEEESGSQMQESFFGVYNRVHEARVDAGRSSGLRAILCDVYFPSKQSTERQSEDVSSGQP